MNIFAALNPQKGKNEGLLRYGVLQSTDYPGIEPFQLKGNESPDEYCFEQRKFID
jgi:hypothetical protein